jgi:hypothetical protein
MNYKKIIILPALFVLSTAAYVSCCGDKPVIYPFYKVTGIGVSTYGSGKAIIDTGVVTMVDTVFLNYGFIQDCSVKAKNPFAFLVNETFALKCPENECGNSGIKSRISSINISSDSVYNSQLPNTSLNNYFKVNYGSGNSVTIDSLTKDINTNKRQLQFDQFFTTTKPLNNKAHSFSLKLMFEDGTLLTASTKRIRWN